jgi:hypothetical protein
VLNAILLLSLYGWLTYRLRHQQPASADAAPATSRTG